MMNNETKELINSIDMWISLFIYNLPNNIKALPIEEIIEKYEYTRNLNNYKKYLLKKSERLYKLKKIEENRE